MKSFVRICLLCTVGFPAWAENARQLDAHEHGVGQLNIAVSGSQVAMELEVPGADIVGFEYEAKSETDHTKIDKALEKLVKPLSLFVLPESAGCSVAEAKAELEGDDHAVHEEHDAHGHDDQGHDDHGDDHGHDAHSDKDHDDHAAHDHADHHDTHEAHQDEAGHTEFHAEYLLTCADISEIDRIEFAYFAEFPNALEVEVQVVSGSGAQAFEVEKDAPQLSLKGAF